MMRKPNSQKLLSRVDGFTIVELTVVLLIVGILASVLIPVVTGRVTDAKYTQALADINMFSTAVESYKNDIGEYPPSGIENATKALLYSTGTVTWKGPYIQVREDRIEVSGTTYQLLDPWGNPYQYMRASDYAGSDGTLNPNPPSALAAEQYYNPYTFQIYSKGKNAKTGLTTLAGTDVDDVNNWYGDERNRN